jgi:hypothetical protein
MQQFRIVNLVSDKNKNYINCDICMDTKKHQHNARGRPLKAHIIIEPIDSEGNQMEINNVRAFFVCEMHFAGLRSVGAVPSIAQLMGLNKA